MEGITYILLSFYNHIPPSFLFTIISPPFFTGELFSSRLGLNVSDEERWSWDDTHATWKLFENTHHPKAHNISIFLHWNHRNTPTSDVSKCSLDEQSTAMRKFTELAFRVPSHGIDFPRNAYRVTKQSVCIFRVFYLRLYYMLFINLIFIYPIVCKKVE